MVLNFIFNTTLQPLSFKLILRKVFFKNLISAIKNFQIFLMGTDLQCFPLCFPLACTTISVPGPFPIHDAYGWMGCGELILPGCCSLIAVVVLCY
jgi:hypothetical protein